jgi:flavin reductase (DIM6/NTAB) family NADH-FMN oxidoreductase RutF/DNA-binding FadR family transcriptional regulator
MATTPQAPVSGDAFRDVIGRFATGVTVVTTRDGDGDHGMTASAISSLSLEPPMLLVCVHRRSRTAGAVRGSGHFTVNVLAEDQAAAAQRFATPVDDRFAGVATTRGPMGTLLLDGCLAHIDCEVEDLFAAATHHIVTGRVQRVAARAGAPLAYFRGQFGQLRPAREDAVTQVLRERVLAGVTDADLRPRALADELSTDVGRVDRALATLRAEGLVDGDPVDGYRAAPAGGDAVGDALDARLGIELGAVELAIGRADPADLEDLRRLAARVSSVLASPAVDPAAYASANTAFHERLVGLAGSAALLDAYRRLSLHGILVRRITHSDALGGAHGADHLAIADALVAGDLTAARSAVRRHAERADGAHAAPATH